MKNKINIAIDTPQHQVKSNEKTIMRLAGENAKLDRFQYTEKSISNAVFGKRSIILIKTEK